MKNNISNVLYNINMLEQKKGQYFDTIINICVEKYNSSSAETSNMTMAPKV